MKADGVTKWNSCWSVVIILRPVYVAKLVIRISHVMFVVDLKKRKHHFRIERKM